MELKDRDFQVFNFAAKEEIDDFAANVLGLPTADYDGLNVAGAVSDYLINRLKELTIVLESNYVDKDWTSLLSFHYSTLFGEYPRFVNRVHIFHGRIEKEEAIFEPHKHKKDYIGYFTVYPSRPHCIGRTLFDARKLGFIPGAMWCEDEVHLAGHRLAISTFPFSGQDGKVMSCAHVSIWNIIRYYSTKYGYYGEHYQADIAQLCEDVRIGRAIPTRGLQWYQVLAGFGALRIQPRVYAKQDPTYSIKRLQEIARGYLNSGIPIILLGDKHAVVGIGLTNPKEKESDIIVNDDNYFPYGVMSKTSRKDCRFTLEELEYVIVPLYSKIVLPYETAEKISEGIANDKKWGFNCSKEMGPVGEAKTFLTSSRSYKEALIKRPNADIFELFARTVPLPKFVWITEYYSQNDPNTVVAEYVLDATTSEHDVKAFLLLHYPEIIWYNRRFKKADLDSDIQFMETPDSPKKWEAFPGNLYKEPKEE